MGDILIRLAALTCSLMLVACAQSGGGPPAATDWTPPPVNADFDYQLGGGYPPPAGVIVVTRDVTDAPPAGLYGICCVNAFQTQSGERSLWPVGTVTDLEDPGFPGEYLVDISTANQRQQAASFLTAQIEDCAAKGFHAAEFDNLDSWTRLDDTPLAGQVPFGIDQATDFARRLVGIAHDHGLSAGQKNTPQLGAARADQIGFDFAVSEECARYGECDLYRAVYDDRLIDIEYDRESFATACAEIGSAVSVVLRDRAVSRPGSPTYEDANC